jgi:hypothetical protein
MKFERITCSEVPSLSLCPKWWLIITFIIGHKAENINLLFVNNNFAKEEVTK